MVYPWQENTWDFTHQLIANQRLPHALLLQGQEGIGKYDFALALAKKILCEENGVNACGQCKSCGLIESHNHPDLLAIEPEEKGKQIKIDDVRTAADFISKTSQQGGAKVLIISPAENMNRFAANALLKTLEEPPQGNTLLLVSHKPSQLIATIRSRCQTIKLQSPNDTMVRHWLEQTATDLTNTSLEQTLFLAQNRPLLALEILEQENNDERYSDFLEIMQGLCGRGQSQQEGYVVLAEKLAKLDVNLALQCFAAWLADIIHWQMHQQESYLNDKSLLDFYRSVESMKVPSAKLMTLYDEVLNTQFLLDSTANINVALALENLFILWLRCFYVRS